MINKIFAHYMFSYIFIPFNPSKQERSQVLYPLNIFTDLLHEDAKNYFKL